MTFFVQQKDNTFENQAYDEVIDQHLLTNQYDELSDENQHQDLYNLPDDIHYDDLPDNRHYHNLPNDLQYDDLPDERYIAMTRQQYNNCAVLHVE